MSLDGLYILLLVHTTSKQDVGTPKRPAIVCREKVRDMDTLLPPAGKKCAFFSRTGGSTTYRVSCKAHNSPTRTRVIMMKKKRITLWISIVKQDEENTNSKTVELSEEDKVAEDE